MGVNIGDTMYFDLCKDVNNNLKHKIDFIIKDNKRLAEHTISTSLANYYLNISMKTIFMNMERSKTNEPHKLVLNLTQRLDLKSLNKHVTLQNSIHLENSIKAINSK